MEFSTMLHLWDKGQFRCHCSKKSVQDKYSANVDEGKHHGVNHAKEVDEMNPPFQRNIRNTSFHHDRTNNRNNGVFESKSSNSMSVS
eukprot:9825638-Ditylum_brightwellii.AAC.1